MTYLSQALIGTLAAGAMAAIAVSPAHARHWDRSYHGNRMHSDDAIQLCVRAVGREASRYGYGRADVTRITGVSRKEGGFTVKGQIVVNSGHRGWDRHDFDRGKFSCKVRYGRVADVNFSGLRGFY